MDGEYICESRIKSFFRKYPMTITAVGVIILAAIVLLVILAMKHREEALIAALKNSDSFKAAIAHAEAHAEVPHWAGAIIDYEFISGNESVIDGERTAEYRIALICEFRTLSAWIFLRKKPEEDWKVWSFGIPG
jgi:hypothetical protein